jgi:hypothetical protein
MRFPGLNQPRTKPPTVGDDRSAEGSPSPVLPPMAAAEQRGAALEPTPEQLRYAGILEKGSLLGLICLFVSFSLYLLGVLEPYIPVEKVCTLWKLDVQQFRSEAKIEAGWSWLSLLGRGDYSNFVGITVLAGVTILCYFATLPVMFRRKDNLYIVLALLQVAVLVFAASGVVALGH